MEHNSPLKKKAKRRAPWGSKTRGGKKVQKGKTITKMKINPILGVEIILGILPLLSKEDKKRISKAIIEQL